MRANAESVSLSRARWPCKHRVVDAADFSVNWKEAVAAPEFV